jgi:hypothetical protein
MGLKAGASWYSVDYNKLRIQNPNEFNNFDGTNTTVNINIGGATRTLFYGVNLIITKLNPSITTSTTADNLGDHTATKNILLNGNYLSNDGGNEGIRVDNSGNVGIGTATPTSRLNIAGGGVKLPLDLVIQPIDLL